jgi:hypothetical protein
LQRKVAVPAQRVGPTTRQSNDSQLGVRSQPGRDQIALVQLGPGREFAFLCYALERLSRRLDAVEQIATLEGQQSHDFVLTAGGRHRQSARREVYELPDPKAVPGHPAILELIELDLSGLLTATTLIILEHKANAVALVEDGNA